MAVQAKAPPYVMTITPRVCDCQREPLLLGRAQTLAKAVTVISGYWNVYLAFYGDQVLWLNFQVVDRRDGLVTWRNGRYTNTSGGFDGITEDPHHPPAGA